MKKIKKYLFWALTSVSVLAAPSIAISCGNTNQDIQQHTLNLTLGTPFGVTDQQADQYKTNLQNFLETKLKASGINTVNITFSDDGYSQILGDFSKKQTDLAFVAPGSLFGQQQALNQDNINVFLQTLTIPFAGDLTETFNQNDSFSSFNSIVDALQTKFARIPWSAQWNDPTNGNGYNADKSIYTDFYDLNSLVPFYRGVLWVQGTDEQIAAIKKAWNDKDWSTFKSYGIIVGKPTSGSKYLAIQNLLKLHFDKPGNSFTTLAQEQNSTTLISSAKQSPLAARLVNNKFHIFADDEGSYGYTKFNSEKNANLYAAPAGQKLELLMVTNPILYNVGLISNKYSKAQIQAIQQAFVDLTKDQTANQWGINQGFNGYAAITDQNSFFDSVNKTFG